MAKKQSKKKRKIDPKSYVQILNSIELRGIHLESCSVKHNREHLIKQKQKGLTVSVRDKVSYEQRDKELRVLHKYYLTVKKPEMAKDFAIKMSASFRLTYLTDSPIHEDFFDVFKDVSLVVNSWPYFREFVQSMTQRMSIQPLTLPLIIRE